MGDTVNRVTFRPETAVLVRSILDTERLNRLGVDMAQTRKDFLNSSGGDFILPSPRQAIHDAISVGHLMGIRRGHPTTDCGQDTRKRHSHSTAKRGTKNAAHFAQALSPIKSRSVEHHGCCLPSVSNSKMSRAVPQPCTSCQRSDLPERFHSHVISVDRSSPESGSVQGPTDDDSQGNWSTKQAVRGLSNLAKLKKKFTWSRKVASLAADNSSLKDDSGIGSQQSSSDELSTHRSTAFYTVSLSPKASNRKSQNRRASDLHAEPIASPPPAQHVANLEEEKPSAKQQPFLLCHLCGRMFGTASLKIHQPQCLQKSLREKEEKAPPPTRRAPPVGRQESTASTSSDALFYGNNAFSLFQKTLVPCPKCARTFAPHRLEAHQKICKQVAPDQENHEEVATIRATAAEGQRNGGGGPRKRPMVTCYICGREFGTRSIAIHEPQCLQKFQWYNEKLPANQKRPEPTRKSSIIE